MAYNHLAGRNFVTIPAIVPKPPSRPQILFVTENYPKVLGAIHSNTFLYRTITHPGAVFPLPNQLLNNLSLAMGIAAINEVALLHQFVNVNNCYVIDTYLHGAAWNPHTPLCGTISQIIDDINDLNPHQVVFCYERSNTRIFGTIIARLDPGIMVIRPTNAAGAVTGNVFKSPTGQWFHTAHYKNGKVVLGFKDQISLVIHQGILIP